MVSSTGPATGQILGRGPSYSQQAAGDMEMAKLKPRYTPAEKATLLMLIKPAERWTADEHRSWAKEQTGFRHFIAANITPIEHYRPKPSLTYNPARPTQKPAA